MSAPTTPRHEEASHTAARADRPPRAESELRDVRRTARVAGLWYLALGITGMLAFFAIRQQLHVPGEPGATMSNLVDRDGLARVGIAVEMCVVVSQAVAAVWFHKLFRRTNPTAAWSVAAFGLVNAIAIMAGAVFLATALAVAGDPGLAPGGDAAATVQLLYELADNSWGMGALFFGLWLIPMGHLARTSGYMPPLLGRILAVGGVGYVVSALVDHGVAGAPTWLVQGLTFPATIGEFWMIGYLLAVGVRAVDGAAAGSGPRRGPRTRSTT